MNAKKCDRCKRYYDWEKQTKRVDVVDEDTPMESYESYDLCDECMEKLVRWLKGEVEE